MAMTTLTEDVSNNCQSSGPVGESDLKKKKKHQKSGGAMRATGSIVPKDTVKRQCVKMSAAKSRKKEMTN